MPIDIDIYHYLLYMKRLIAPIKVVLFLQDPRTLRSARGDRNASLCLRTFFIYGMFIKSRRFCGSSCPDGDCHP